MMWLMACLLVVMDIMVDFLLGMMNVTAGLLVVMDIVLDFLLVMMFSFGWIMGRHHSQQGQCYDNLALHLSLLSLVHLWVKICQVKC